MLFYLILGWFSHRTGTSVDEGSRKSNNWLDQWLCGKLGTGSQVQSFPHAFPSPNDVPVMLLNQPNIALGGVRFWIASDPQVIKHQHLTFSVAVRSSLAHILRQVQWWSVAIVTRYDIISSRWSSHFWVKVYVFSTFFNNKSKSCG